MGDPCTEKDTIKKLEITTEVFKVKLDNIEKKVEESIDTMKEFIKVCDHKYATKEELKSLKKERHIFWVFFFKALPYLIFAITGCIMYYLN